VPRSPSSLLFCLTLGLSFALLVWWSLFQALAASELEAAGEALARGDAAAAARALGAPDVDALTELAARRRRMFASEGIFFAVVLLALGAFYLASVQRERLLRRNQDRFLAAATHELKTPLATIVLLLESLRDDRIPEGKRSRYLTNGLLEAERLERGLHNVLTAAGLRTAGTRLRKNVGDLAGDVRAAAAALEARALAAGITLEVEATRALPVARDADALQIVLRNLLDNAIKYSPEGRRVRIATTRSDHEATVTVEDEGRGFDATELQHAFEPFWRGSDVATGGAGLGLHLVHELVRAHGGSVAVESQGRDRGSRFVVHLPAEPLA
jgi:signal transduction histidine kinase